MLCSSRAACWCSWSGFSPWQIKQIKDSHQSTTHLDLLHSFDANGNVDDISDYGPSGLHSRSMSYDGLDRLLSVNAPQLFGLARYAYDPLDNLREADLGARKYRYQYDAAWRLSQIRTDTNQLVWNLGYDSRGNLTSKGSTGYTFDPANRLKAIPSLGADYYYDAHGRRVGMIRQQVGGLYSLYTRDGKLRGGPDSTQGAGQTVRLWQVYLGDTLVGTRREPVSGGSITHTYHHTDLLGSPLRETNQSRGVVNETHYSPYGEALNRTVDGPGYTGHRMDGHSGLVYMQQRYYDPVVGRFLSVDPVTVDMSGDLRQFNRYGYAYGNP